MPVTDKERFELWQYTTLSELSPRLSLVRNSYTGALMLRRVTDADTYPVMRLLCEIRSAHLMAVYDTVENGGMCISLCEYIDGLTLEELVSRDGLRTEEQTRAIVAGLCEGLETLHSHGIVHRDIKPSNVMVDTRGMVKIIDYDIVRVGKEDRVKDTRILGTVGYAPPEQFGFHQTDGRADIYSVGVLMNYLLTGRLPDEQLYEGPLRAVIDRCIQMDADNRFSSAGQLRKVIEGRLRPDTAFTPRERRRRPFRPLPGFRGKKLWLKIVTGIALASYIELFIVTVLMLIQEGIRGNRFFGQHLYISVVMLVFFSGLPYLLFGDVGYLSERLYPSNPARGKQLTVVLGVASLIIGTVMMFIYPYVSPLSMFLY